jgi:hypothetical protein
MSNVPGGSDGEALPRHREAVHYLASRLSGLIVAAEQETGLIHGAVVVLDDGPARLLVQEIGAIRSQWSSSLDRVNADPESGWRWVVVSSVDPSGGWDHGLIEVRMSEA